MLSIIADEVHFLILKTLKLIVNLGTNNVEMVALKSDLHSPKNIFCLLFKALHK